jgi:hypothetical protein
LVPYEGHVITKFQVAADDTALTYP